ncbi:hypothetical protein C3486_14320 [Streptomyces sp. Ru73]|uniref:hypothetical protein n=1 Tax=Streptomyces sp. Ru73 TaxID=2080748 RepID=UPI000CDCE3C5|nr:hypothetical protein [Streptomyces sp. Ru73]POX40255.1 hypothetical protein C3486_14320 [Streptomyces sp. Ru73]
MSDDYFGRLLARHAPARRPLPGAPGGRADAPGSGTGPAGRTRVQPRLPGPFERIESLGGAPAEPEAPAALYPRAPLAAPADGERLRLEREIRTTERETTVLRAEAARTDAPEPDGQPVRPTAPLLRPAVRPEPGPRPVVPEGQRAGARRTGGRAEEPGPARPTAATPAPGSPDAAPRAVAPALRPRTEVPAARDAVRAASAGRRGQRPAERVVHVQIGRLEVSAAGAERPAAGGRGTARPERRGPALSLADYLARGERTDRR